MTTNMKGSSHGILRIFPNKNLSCRFRSSELKEEILSNVQHSNIYKIVLSVACLVHCFVSYVFPRKFQTNSSVHNINTRNKHHLHRPVANLSCFQKGASYSGIIIFNSLPRSITNLKNENTQFKVALKKFLNAHCFYCVDEFFTCTDDMYC
jgi:hypothetical protein